MHRSSRPRLACAMPMLSLADEGGIKERSDGVEELGNGVQRHHE